MSEKIGSVLQVRVHFSGVDLSLGNKLLAIAKKHELSSSRVAIMAIRVGLIAVDEYLSGIRLDLDALGFS